MMKMKHFTFDLDYFPITNSNVFHNIKIEKNKNYNSNKLPLKRFPLKNEIKIHEIPDLMFFEKSNKKPKLKIQPQNLSPISNQTKKSQYFSFDQLQWSFLRRADQNLQTQRKVQSCPKPSSTNLKSQDFSFLRNSVKPKSLNQNQKPSQKLNILHDINYFQRHSHKKSQLQSLEQCQSQFDQSSQNSLLASKLQKQTFMNQASLNSQNQKKIIKNFDKHNKSKKTEKSNSSKSNNPEIISNKEKGNKKNHENLIAKNPIKNDEALKTNNKFISLTRKSYYLVGSKNNKNRSLDKEKKVQKKNYSREQGNILLSNGDISGHSSTGPSNCRNSSLSNSTANSKVKAQSSKNKNLSLNKNNKSKYNHQNQRLLQIVKKTGQILNKYKDQCTQLKKQKEKYQQKYEQAVKKLHRIKQEIQFVMKTQ